MRVEILRTYLPLETLSTLNVLDDHEQIKFTCKGLEPQKNNNVSGNSCILEDTYLVTKELDSPKHHYPHFRVEDKHGRVSVLWHIGNYRRNSEACYLPGDSFGDRDGDGLVDVLNSKTTLEKLLDILPDKFYATYKEKL